MKNETEIDERLKVAERLAREQECVVVDHWSKDDPGNDCRSENQIRLEHQCQRRYEHEMRLMRILPVKSGLYKMLLNTGRYEVINNYSGTLKLKKEEAYDTQQQRGVQEDDGTRSA